jgi:putative spermidine/putrescine transport system permease protein
VFRSRAVGVALALPAAVFVAAAFLLPVLILARTGFETGGGYGVGNFVAFFSAPLHQAVFWRTMRLAVLVTGISAVVGYACALAIVGLGPKWRGTMVGLVVLPLMISPVARTYAWVVVLGRTGVVNALLVNVGLTDEPIRFLFTETAVAIGLIQLFLPLMVLSLLSSLENLPRDVVPAARTLGASWLQVFVRVILPLTREGLVIGGTLVFTGSVTAYITPAVLGGTRVLMLETLLVQRINVANDIVTGAVIAVILVATTLAANQLLRRLATARGARA